MRTVGLDLSLTSTGIAVADGGTIVKLGRIQSKGKKDATLAQRQYRLHTLRLEICRATEGADLVAVEGPSFGQQRQGGQHDRAGLWWLVLDWILSGADLGAETLGRPVVEIPPACVKKYATGKGNAPKDAVLAGVVRRFPTAEITGNDEADALVLAAMAARHVGDPIDDLPLTHLAAMEAVRWPELKEQHRA